jgi:hypothetical protein
VSEISAEVFFAGTSRQNADELLKEEGGDVDRMKMNRRRKQLERRDKIVRLSRFLAVQEAAKLFFAGI